MLRVKNIPRKILQSIMAVFIFFFITYPVSPQVQISSNLTLVSRYIWRGFDTIPNNRPSVQPSLAINFGKSGLWFNLWSAMALVDTNFVELDFIWGYDKALSKDLSLSAGVGYFTFPSYRHYPDKNSTSPEVWLGTTFCSIPFSPRLTAYYDFNLGDGLYATLNLEKSFPLGGKVLCAAFLLGYTTQYKKIGVDPGLSDICFRLSTDFAFKRLTLTPCFNYVIVPNKTINRENEIWAGLSTNYNF
jgi:uncharacterized protein (TIGR02001 family)